MNEGRHGEAFFIRTATRADLDAIRVLLVETWHNTYDPLIGAEKVTEITDSWHSLPALAARLNQPHSEFIVADSGKSVSGMAYAEAGEGGKIVTLRQLYVLPAYQGRGIGSMLLNEIANCYPEADRMQLEVEEKNARAVSFYRSHGFREICKKSDPLGLEVALYERAAAVWSGHG